MKYTKRQREQAALILACCASTIDIVTFDAAEALDALGPQFRLAYDAVQNITRASNSAEAYAEAECMVREGWEP